MATLTDLQIRKWIQTNERFEGKSDGGGLYLRFRKTDKVPAWIFRYRLKGKQRVMAIGSYTVLSLADARKTVKELAARVALGYDVASEKQERKHAEVLKRDSEKWAWTVGKLCDEYFERNIVGHWKHPNIVRSRIDNDIKPAIGKLHASDIKPMHIDELLQKIVKRGAPTVSNDVLRWLKRIFDFGIKRQIIEMNPASPFNLSDAGGKESSRDRWLTVDELKQLFKAIRAKQGTFTIENACAVKLLLMLAVRKEELFLAKWEEFDLPKALWSLSAGRTKTSQGIEIPLPRQSVEILQLLKELSCGSDYVFPAKKLQLRMTPHADVNRLNAALAKHIKPQLKNIPNFTIHDLRRTARTHLAALGVESFVAERCLNHKIKGVEGVYNRHDYFEERKEALQMWADLIELIESKT